MERVCALALCLLFSLCSATSPPKNPNLIPLNCNETNHAGLAADLINEDRDHGFIIKPFRVKSIYEQKVASVAGSSLYYINFEVKETPCSVLSHKKWKDCKEEVPFHERVFGECKSIIYISRPWRILKLLSYSCTLGTVPSSSVVFTCPDCPTPVKDITPKIKAKADRMVEQFNRESNQTNHFKIDEIERVRTQWVFGESFFVIFTIKETECSKALKSIVRLDKCKSLEDSKAHVGFCKGSSYFEPNRNEAFSVNCEIYDPQHDDDHHHHHKHGTCDHGKEGDQVKKSTDNAGQDEAGAGKAAAGEAAEGKAAAGEAAAGEAGAGEAAAGEAAAGEAGAGEAAAGEAGAGEAGADAAEEKCELGKGKRCGHHRGHKHHCHPGHHHHHHPGHHHHHHDHDNRNHSHPAEHGSSEEITDKQPFKSSKGSFQVFYPSDETSSIPAPTIQRPTSEKQTEEPANFPDGPSPLDTCPGQQISESS